MIYRNLTALLAAFISILTACSGGGTHTYSRPLMGTIVNITIIADSKREADAASEKAFGAIEEIERLMSPKSEAGDVYRLNEQAAYRPVRVSDGTFMLVRRANEVAARTGGAFDISFAALERLWNWKDPNFIPPNAMEVARALALVNYRYIRLNSAASEISFAVPGMRIGLGGIAKGYAAMRGMEELKAAGVTNAIVAAAGDMQVAGSKDGGPWRVGLMHPRKKELICTLLMRDGDAVSTSGDYERFAEYGGVRYHHIIDPKTGYPARGFVSVSVISKSPVDSDAYSTALFVMGPGKAAGFMKEHPELEVVLIDEDLRMSASKGLRERIVFEEVVGVAWR
ncbi:MAG: FAD:protein FMN transferase [Spirochaetes bacterium]|nr:MAG: FAD:protein FMN transferase [Spirochaetota bacterium]